MTDVALVQVVNTAKESIKGTFLCEMTSAGDSISSELLRSSSVTDCSDIWLRPYRAHTERHNTKVIASSACQSGLRRPSSPTNTSVVQVKN
ncbi:hypothetical protein J6590_028920 [Homalodisca vitripennis]|nr:hypothetical protein J6590_028920 [Homalodisca vitripennis]